MTSPSTVNLRPYQQVAKDAVRDVFRRGHRRALLVGATAFGKTHVAASIIEEVVKRGKRVLFLADRVSLIDQTSMRLWEMGIQHGVIQADRSFGRSEQVLVCSQQTLEKRGFIDDADLVIIDEAHTWRRKTIAMIKAMNPYVIGLTATPMTDGLGEFYDEVVNGASTKLLQDEGWMVPLEVYIATEVDMTGGIKGKSGEWTSDSAASCALPIIGDIVTDWTTNTLKVFGEPVKTLVFVPTVAYGQELCKEFRDAGCLFEQVSYKQTALENQRAISRLRNGVIQGLISVEALVKGIDIPDIQCLVSARPYRSSLASHIQQLGRGTRAFPGKEFCLLNDHCNNYLRFAVEAEAFWNSGEWDLSKNTKEARKKGSEGTGQARH